LTLLSDGPDLNIFRVTEVTRDSPAQKAGFEKGDEIAGVDSTAANRMTLGKLRELLSLEGTQHVFAVKRKTKIEHTGHSRRYADFGYSLVN